MRLLFTMDSKDYTENEDMKLCECVGVRAVIERDGKYAMQKSSEGEYKIPGGMVEQGESLMEALCREVREETGLIVKPDSVREIGEILELRRDIFEPEIKFMRHSYYYRCEVQDEVTKTNMTDSEKERGFRLAWETAEKIIKTNERLQDAEWKRRDTIFLKRLTEGSL